MTTQDIFLLMPFSKHGTICFSEELPIHNSIKIPIWPNWITKIKRPHHCSPLIGNISTLLRIKPKSGSCSTTSRTSGASDCRGVVADETLLMPPPRICCTRGDGVGGLLILPLVPFSPPSLRNSRSRPVAEQHEEGN